MREHNIVGQIIDQPATYAANGAELSPPSFHPGYHVNMLELPAGWEAFQVFPANPQRVYAGADTLFLRFADEAQWLAEAEAAGVIAPAEAPSA